MAKNLGILAIEWSLIPVRLRLLDLQPSVVRMDAPLAALKKSLPNLLTQKDFGHNLEGCRISHPYTF
jgi:hypothetical protein